MDEETPQLTQEELDQRILSSPVGGQGYDEGVSRGANILGSVRKGFVDPIVSQAGALSKIFGDKEAVERIRAIQRDPNALGGGVLPVNPTMEKDFSTGVARAIGGAPLTIAQAEAGLPALVGAGALGGYDTHAQQQEDYERRAAAGELAPGEEAPSAWKEVAKGAASNAAMLGGGMAAGAIAKRILPTVEGTAKRVLTGYGGIAAGNLGGSALARKIETGSFGYENPAEAGSDLFTGLVTFGGLPTKHLLADKATAYKTPEERAQAKADAKAKADAEAAANSATAAMPGTILSTMSRASLGMQKMVQGLLPGRRPDEPPPGSMEGTVVDPAAEWPYVGTSTPGERHLVQLAGQNLASHMMGEGDIASVSMTAGTPYSSRLDQEQAAQTHALYRIRQTLDTLRNGGDEGNQIAQRAGLSRTHAIAAFAEAERIIMAGEPVKPNITIQQQIATQKGAAALGHLNDLFKSEPTPTSAAEIHDELERPNVQAELRKRGMPPLPANPLDQPAYVRMLGELLDRQDAEIEQAHRDAATAMAAKFLAQKLAGPAPTLEEQQQIWAAHQEAVKNKAAADLAAKLKQDELDAAARAEKEAADLALAHEQAVPATALPALGARLRVGGKPLVEIPTPPEAAVPPPILPTNETGQNIQQIPHPQGQPPVVPANNAPLVVRGVGELGAGSEEKRLQQPGPDQPVNQSDVAVTGVRGQGELGQGAPQRPLLEADYTPEEQRWRKGLQALVEKGKPLLATPEEIDAGYRAQKRLDAIDAEVRQRLAGEAPPEAPPAPESRKTLLEQQRQLHEGQRKAMLFTPGEEELPVPPGMKRFEGKQGVYHYDPKKLSAEYIDAVDRAGLHGSILNLGDETKAAAIAAPGKTVVLTEHTPEGVEVRASVTSEGELEAKRQEFEKTKTPGNIIGTRSAEEVLAARKGPPMPETMKATDAAPAGPGEPDLVVLGCGKKKCDMAAGGKTEAGNLYIGSLFSARRDFAQAQPRPWAIVSALHGMLAPGKKIESYDRTMGDMTPAQRKAWQKQVREWATDYFGGDTKGKTIEVHAGEEYVKAMNEALKGLGIKLTTPMKGKGVGKQMASYKAGVERTAEVEKPAAAEKPAEPAEEAETEGQVYPQNVLRDLYDAEVAKGSELRYDEWLNNRLEENDKMLDAMDPQSPLYKAADAENEVIVKLLQMPHNQPLPAPMYGNQVFYQGLGKLSKNESGVEELIKKLYRMADKAENEQDDPHGAIRDLAQTLQYQLENMATKEQLALWRKGMKIGSRKGQLDITDNNTGTRVESLEKPGREGVKLGRSWPDMVVRWDDGKIENVPEHETTPAGKPYAARIGMFSDEQLAHELANPPKNKEDLAALKVEKLYREEDAREREAKDAAWKAEMEAGAPKPGTIEVIAKLDKSKKGYAIGPPLHVEIAQRTDGKGWTYSLEMNTAMGGGGGGHMGEAGAFPTRESAIAAARADGLRRVANSRQLHREKSEQVRYDAIEAAIKKIPEPKEAKTAVKVESPAAAVKEVKTEFKGRPGAFTNEVKKQLTSQLERALAKAPEKEPPESTPSYQPGFRHLAKPAKTREKGKAPTYERAADDITIHIPGDGEFRIANNQEAIQHVLKAIRTMSAEGSTEPRGPRPVGKEVLTGEEKPRKMTAEELAAEKAAPPAPPEEPAAPAESGNKFYETERAADIAELNKINAELEGHFAKPPGSPPGPREEWDHVQALLRRKRDLEHKHQLGDGYDLIDNLFSKAQQALGLPPRARMSQVSKANQAKITAKAREMLAADPRLERRFAEVDGVLFDKMTGQPLLDPAARKKIEDATGEELILPNARKRAAAATAKAEAIALPEGHQKVAKSLDQRIGELDAQIAADERAVAEPVYSPERQAAQDRLMKNRAERDDLLNERVNMPPEPPPGEPLTPAETKATNAKQEAERLAGEATAERVAAEKDLKDFGDPRRLRGEARKVYAVAKAELEAARNKEAFLQRKAAEAETDDRQVIGAGEVRQPVDPSKVSKTWMDPEGKFHDAGNNHQTFAQRRYPGMSWPDAQKALRADGWVRVQTDGKNLYVSTTGPELKLSRAQKNALEDYSLEHGRVLHDTGYGEPKTLYGDDRQAIGAPNVVSAEFREESEREKAMREKGFYSKMTRWAKGLPDAIREIPAKPTIKGRFIPGRTIEKGKGGKPMVIPDRTEPDKVFSPTSVVEQFKELAREGKVPAEELKWSGIIPWLEGKKEVTQKEIEDYIAEYGTVRVGEVALGKAPINTPEAAAKERARQEQVQRALTAQEAAQRTLNEAHQQWQEFVRTEVRAAREAAWAARKEEGGQTNGPKFQAADKALGEKILQSENLEKALGDAQDAKRVADTVMERAEMGLPERTPEEILANMDARTALDEDYHAGKISQGERIVRQDDLQMKFNGSPEINALVDKRAPLRKALENANAAIIKHDIKLSPASRKWTQEQVDTRNKLDTEALRLRDEREQLEKAIEDRLKAEEDAKPKEQRAIYQGHMGPFKPVKNYYELVLTKEPKMIPAEEGIVVRRATEAERETQIPFENTSQWVVERKDGTKDFYQYEHEANNQAKRLSTKREEGGQDFRPEHFVQIKHQIANGIVDVRKTVKGRMTSLIQEAQSDRFKQGSKHGYVGERDEAAVQKAMDKWSDYGDTVFEPALVKAVDEMQKLGYPGELAERAVQAIHNMDDLRIDLGDKMTPENDAIFSDYLEKRKASNRLRRAYDKISNKSYNIPDAPFRGDHSLRILQRVIRDAVMAGHDAVAWNFGDTVNERYNLEQAVDKITWERARRRQIGEQNGHPVWSVPNEDVEFRVKVHTKGGEEIALEVADDGTVLSGHIRGNDLAGKELSEVVGDPAIADRIIKSEPPSKEEKAALEKNYKQAVAAERAAEKKRKAASKAYQESENMNVGEPGSQEDRTARLARRDTLWQPVREADAAYDASRKALYAAEQAYRSGIQTMSGQDFMIGGEGKRRNYDQRMVQLFGDYVKQWGAHVETDRIPLDPDRPVSYAHRDKNGNITINGGTRARVEQEVAERGGTLERANDQRPVHLIEITPEMRRAVMEEGQPIAAPDAKVVDELAASYKVPKEDIEAFDKKAREEMVPKLAEGAGELMGQEVPVVHDSTLTDGIGVVPTRNGGVEIHIGKNYLAKFRAKHGENATEALTKALEEEGIHVAVLKSIHEEWSKLDPATRPDFYEFSKQVMGRVTGEMQAEIQKLRDAGKHKEAFAIEEAVRHAKEIYDGQLDGGNSMTGRQILEKMGQDPQFAFTYANEMLRQLAQLRKSGEITESTFQRLVKYLSELYQRAQQHLQRVVGTAHEGGLGQSAKNILRRVEELTREPEAQAKRVKEPVFENAGKIKHLEDKVIPWYDGETDANSRTSSRDVEGYSPRQAAQDFLLGSRGTGEESHTPEQRHEIELAKLAHFEAGRGRLISRERFIANNPDIIGGGEHQGFLDPTTDRWVKLTRKDSSGLVSHLEEAPPYDLPPDASLLGTRKGTPSDYFERMRLAGSKLSDDQQYHGVWLDSHGEPGGLVISQPHVEGKESTRPEISKTLTDAGFKRVGIDTWYRPSDRIVLEDARPANFVTKAAKEANIPAKATPIDVPIRVADDAFHKEAMRLIESGRKFQKPSERKLPFPPKPDDRQVMGAPKLVEKAVDKVKELVREGEVTRPYWLKAHPEHRRFSKDVSTAVAGIENLSTNEGVRVTNALYNAFADITGAKRQQTQQGWGEFSNPLEGLKRFLRPGVGKPTEQLVEAAKIAFPLREAGYADAVYPEERKLAFERLQDFVDRIDAALQSSSKDVVEAAKALKPIYDKALLLAKNDEGQAIGLATAIHQETGRQMALAATNDLDINQVENYIRRIYEESAEDKAARYVPRSTGRGGIIANDKGFAKPREYLTAVDAMENGLKLANLDTAQLVGHGEAGLLKLIGEKEMLNQLRATPAPVTGRMVISDKYEVENVRKGEMVKRPPEGYQAVEIGGKPVYIEQNVAPLFRLLSAPSSVRGNLAGQTALGMAREFKAVTLMIDTYHSVRLALTLAGLTGQNWQLGQFRRFIKRGQAALDFRPEDLDGMVRRGEMTKADADWARQSQKYYDIGTRAGVNWGKQLDDLYEQLGKPLFVRKFLPAFGKPGKKAAEELENFNKFVFQKQARAAMMVGFQQVFERNMSRFGGKKSRTEIERISARETNEIFGNLGRSSILKSKSGQDWARLFMLAPNWNEGRLWFQGRALAQAGRFAGQLLRGKPELPGSAVGTMAALAAASFGANQVINLFSRGTPTWENEDGHKMDAWLPGGRHGFYYSPFNLGSEDVHTLVKYTNRQSPLESLERMALNKASGLGRAGAALMGTDAMGRPLPGDTNRLKQAAKSALPLPIFTSPVANFALQPELSRGFKADLIKQALGMGGFKVDAAESPEQRVRMGGSKIYPQQFPKANAPGDFARLRSFVNNEKMGDATSEILRLVARGKTEADILRSFAPTRTFGQTKAQDALLRRTPALSADIPRAMADRSVDYNTLRQAIALAKSSPQWQEAQLAGRATKQPVQ